MYFQPRHSASRQATSRSRRGIALVWVVIAAVVILGIVGLAIDTARVLLVSHELQNAGDAAALAGAAWVRTDTAQARVAAISLARANKAEGVAIEVLDNPSNDPNGQIVIGRYDPATKTFTATLTGPNAVKVITQRSATNNGSVPLIFGAIFGVSVSDVKREAIAMGGGGTGAGLIALSPTGTGLSENGTPVLNVQGGAVWVNSSNPSVAVNTVGTTARIDASEIDVVGGTSVGPPVFSGTINEGVPVAPDPLIDLPAPDWTQMTQRTYSTQSTLLSGYYPAGLDIQGNADVTLSPGIYVLDGVGLSVKGKASLNAAGVMFYIKGTGSVDLGGTGNIVITPIDPATSPADALYEGVSIFQARNDARIGTIIGTNDTHTILGTLYFPDNLIEVSGTGDLTAGNPLIANKITVSGTGTITIVYDGRNPAPGNKVFLVK